MKAKKITLILLTAIMSVAFCLGISVLAACKKQPEQQNPTEKKLVSIVMDTKPTKLVYEIGEEVDTSGMKVTAKYSNDTTEDVTSKCSTSMDGQKIKAETTSYFVKYTYEKVTKTARVDITVNKEEITYTNFESDADFKEPYVVAAESTADMVFITSVDSSTMHIDGALELTGTAASGNFTYTERNDYLGEISGVDGTPITDEAGTPLSKKIAVMTGTYATSDGEMMLKTKTVSRLRTTRLDTATVQNARVITNDSGEITGLDFGSMVKDGRSSLFFGWGKANASSFLESNAQNYDLEPYICYFSAVKDGVIPSNLRIYHASVDSVEVESAPVKVEYTPGESFSSIGMSLRVNFAAGKSIVVTEGFTADKETLSESDSSVTISYNGYFAEAKTCTQEITVRAAYSDGLYALALEGQITDFSYTYGEPQTLTDVLKSSAMVVKAKYVESADKAVTEYSATGFDAQGAAIEGNKITSELKYYEISYTEEGRTVKATVNVSSVKSRTPYNIAEASGADYVFYTTYVLAGRTNNTNHDVALTMKEGETGGAGEFRAYMYLTDKKGMCIIGTYSIEGNTVNFNSAEKIELVGSTTMYSAVAETAEFVINENDQIIGLDFGSINGFFGLAYDKTDADGNLNVTGNPAVSLGKPASSACLVRIVNHDMG